MLVNPFFHQVFKGDFYKIKLDITSLIAADFGAAAVMISFGGILGKCNLAQLCVMAFFELIFYSINEAIGIV